MTKLILLTVFAVHDISGGGFFQDFRSKTFPDANFDLVGPEAASRVKAESEGLRITLPAHQLGPAGVGVRARFSIKGDFEITAAYEIIKADPPSAGFGVGFEMYLTTDTPTMESIAFYRLIRPNGSDVYATNRLTIDKQGRRISYIPNLGIKESLAPVKSGQFRITRRDGQAVLFAADKDAQEFREQYRFGLGTEDVTRFWLAANPGNAPNPVDLRILELRIRGMDPNTLEFLAGVHDPASPRTRSLRWLLLLFALGIIFGALWIWRSRSRGLGPESAD